MSKNVIKVSTKDVLFPVAEDLYGVFFEDINRAGDGGIYPEMIRNRSFEDSLVPDGCTVDPEQKVYINRGGWSGAFNHGEGMDDWAEKVPYTPIPGWYSEDAEIKLTEEDTLNDKRRCALVVDFKENGKVWNIGYAGVPVKNQDTYKFYLFLKNDCDFNLKVTLESKDKKVYGEAVKNVSKSSEWQRVDFEINSEGEDFDGVIALSADREVKAVIGFTSLMPEKTYNNHGLRTDIVEMLKGLTPKFMRYPGGCIVEGLSKETAMRFPNTIGPVWERPSHNLMWHYRTTNGFGYHEFLQLCEDINMEPMYVCNCGMSCQARVGEYFEEDTVDAILQETLDALEYAMGDENTKYGAMRVAAGHKEPFNIKYLEIGNENFGKEYNERYAKFYEALKKAYPDVIYISNAHTERDGLPTECVDEHYYSAPEFFLENETRFDSYDRNAPFIFLGEYAVNGGNTIASMECAMAEAVFLTGVERNQDIVKLSAYAPLFQNSDYTAWKPNLIVFDNHQIYGIPSYHAIAMMGANRGKEVVKTDIETEMQPPIYMGIPGIQCEKEGLTFKNAKVNGKPVDISRMVYGAVEKDGDLYALKQCKSIHEFTGKNDVWNKTFGDFIRGRRRPGAPSEDDFMWAVFGDENLEEYTFEIDMKFDRENPVTLSVWNYHPETDAGCNEPKDYDWHFGSVRRQNWKIAEGKSTTRFRHMFDPDAVTDEKDVEIDYTKFNTYKVVADHYGYTCYINDVEVQSHKHNLHPAVYSVTTTDDENIIVKLVNASEAEECATVEFDCEIGKEYTAEVLAATPESQNSMENKLNVSPVLKTFECDGKAIDYKLPAYSVNILKVKKV